MGFLSRLFGREEPVIQPDIARTDVSRADILQKESSAPAPKMQIRYRSDLITKLVDDHRKLVALYTDINNTFAAGDLTGAVTRLRYFKTGIQEHLLTEKIQLYVYLQYLLAEDKLAYDLMRSLHKEMDGIGRAVLAFLEKYDSLDKNRMLLETFPTEFKAIGGVLVDRISREENTLYPLYVPS